MKEMNNVPFPKEKKNKVEGIIRYKDISWTKKEFNELFSKGDIIYVQKKSNNKYIIKIITF